MEAVHRYFIINKPVGMVSQFISSHPVRLLGELDFDFPVGTHAIGRLDSDSEGLLLLTTNKKVTRLLFQGDETHERVYLVQLNNIVRAENVEKLRTGVEIKIKEGKLYKTPSCKVEQVALPASIYQHAFTDLNHGEHSWLLISLTEGKFRQVRKMIAAIRHRCKRLIRISIEELFLEQLQPGEVKEISEKIFFEKLHIKY